MGETRLPQPGWRIRPLLGMLAVAAVIFASWFLPGTREFWNWLDTGLFRFLNGSLSLGHEWQIFWALANNRMVDVVSGTLTGLIIIWWLWGQPREVQYRICASVGALAIVLMVVPFTTHYLNRHYILYHRASPTLVFDDALRLTQLVPWADTKDLSSRSFPGDHAFILVAIVLYFWYLAPRKIVIASVVMSVLFLLPRLVGGAHWLTDNVMGGVVPALMVIAAFLDTPLCYRMTNLFVPIVRLAMMLIPKPLRIPDHKGSRSL